LADDAVAALKAYPWPGNVRELRNVLERGLLVSREERVRAADLRLAAAPPHPRTRVGTRRWRGSSAARSKPCSGDRREHEGRRDPPGDLVQLALRTHPQVRDRAFQLLETDYRSKRPLPAGPARKRSPHETTRPPPWRGHCHENRQGSGLAAAEALASLGHAPMRPAFRREMVVETPTRRTAALRAGAHATPRPVIAAKARTTSSW